MLVVDTNILVYAANANSPFHQSCRRWLDQQRVRQDAWYTTWPILYEFLRVVSHPRVLRHPWTLPNAWDFIRTLMASPGLSVLGPTLRHSAIAGELIAEFPYLAGNIAHDLHTVVLMREHGIKQICTRDADFHQFAFLEVIDPVQAR